MCHKLSVSQFSVFRLWLAWCVYLASLFTLVFTPNLGPQSPDFLLGVDGLTERVLNVFLLVPLAPLLTKSFTAIPLLLLYLSGPMTSCCIEIIQMWIPGRVSDPVDVAMNSLGFFAVVRLSLERTRRNY